MSTPKYLNQFLSRTVSMLLGCICIPNLTYYEVGAWSNGYARSSRFFWISDINTMLQKLAKYQHDIHLRCPGAQKALEDFKAQQVELVADIREVSSNLHRNMVKSC